MITIAIDPGASGGIAVRRGSNVFAYPMPKTEVDFIDMMQSLAREDPDRICYVEDVGGYVGKAQPGSAMFKFGANYSMCKCVPLALDIPVVLLRPQKWQKVFSLGTKASCKNDNEWKNKLKTEAQRRFPNLKPTLKTADALLILEAGRILNAQN